MRLTLISEGSLSSLHRHYSPERVKQYSDALSFMPPKKVEHSLRVGSTVAKSGLGSEEVEAAILHDYIERGGDLTKLADLGVSEKALKLMKMLSIQEKTPGMDDTAEVQHHIELMLSDPHIDQHSKDVAIIIKCADRIDNLAKRIKANKLEPHYLAASRKLFTTLLKSYHGDRSLLKHILKEIDTLGA